ncbi:hypothetical protein [Georgenia daeguensis]|uniref:Uncharacterized protein n=1 Tax=Georgenia daeguensis TaxID=908355 RepID=A0ABP8EU44_9MICO
MPHRRSRTPPCPDAPRGQRHPSAREQHHERADQDGGRRAAGGAAGTMGGTTTTIDGGPMVQTAGPEVVGVGHAHELEAAGGR